MRERSIYRDIGGRNLCKDFSHLCLTRILETWLSKPSITRSPALRQSVIFCGIVSHMLDGFSLASVDENAIL